MKKETSIFLEHILESISRIEEFTEGMSKEEFMGSVKTQDAVIRRLEILGEAAKNISPEFTKKHSEVEWKDIVRTRDKLIHGYFGVDLNLTWGIMKDDLPSLKTKIAKILEELKKEKKKK